jgi:hypothetical protein
MDPRDPNGPAPLHELYSGEFAVAVSYDGMSPMFLERCLRYPEVDTMSNFLILQEPLFDTDTDSDGINEGMSRVANDDLEVTIHYDMDLQPEGMAMGRGLGPAPSYKLSDPFTLKLRYDFKNISGADLDNVDIFKFDHTHTANNETATGNNFVYDNVMYNFGALPGFNYDFTSYGTNSGLTDGFATGSQFTDHVSIQYDMAPAEYGFGTYDGHGAGNPSPSLYCTVKNGSTLGSEMTLFGGEVAGAARFSLGTIMPSETKSLEFLLAIQTEAEGDDFTGCLHLEEATPGTQPTITIGKGACPGQSSLIGQYDIVTGSLSDLSFVDGCSPGNFDCTAVQNLLCMEKGYGFDQKDLMADAHALDLIIYLSRPESRFTSWGSGRQLDGFPVERFLFTPSTVVNVDVVDVCASLNGSADFSASADHNPLLHQQRFTYDVDAWANEMHELLLERAKTPELPTP